MLSGRRFQVSSIQGMNELRQQKTVEEYDQIDYAKIVDAYKGRFADASDFTFSSYLEALTRHRTTTP